MSLFKKLGKVLKKVVKVAAPIVGGVVGGPLGASIGGAVSSALAGGKAAKNAGNTAASGYDAAAVEYRNALANAQGQMQPYSAAGIAGLDSLNKVNSGDYSGFMNSPDYKYALEQGLAGVQGSAAARGGLYSGNAMRALQATGSGLASQNLNNYRNALQQQIGVGQNAAGTLTNAGFNAAQGIGVGLTGSSDARASGIVGKSNAYQTGISELGTLAGNALGNALAKKKKPVARLTYPVSI